MDKVEEERTVNHYDPVVEGVEVYRLVTGERDGSFLWSYVYPGAPNAAFELFAFLECSLSRNCATCEPICTNILETKQ